MLVNSFPFREILDLNTQLQEKKALYLKAFIIQRIIKILCQQEMVKSSERILKEVLLDRLLEKKGSFLLQGVAFEKYIRSASGGLISGLMQMKENGMEPPKELLDLFEGETRKSMKSFFLNKEQLEVSFILEAIPEDGWRKKIIGEAAAAWRPMRLYSLFMQPDNIFFKIFGTDYAGSLESQINFYLNSYVAFIKPIVHKYAFSRSMPNLMTAFYFFVYLQHLTRIYPLEVSDELIRRIEREQEDFMERTVQFPLEVKQRNRREVRVVPFFGWWCEEQGKASQGQLIPTHFCNLQTISKYTSVTPLLQITFYQVVGDHESNSYEALGLVRTEVLNENSLQLLVYTMRASFKDAWFSNFVRKINAKMHTQDELMNIILS